MSFLECFPLLLTDGFTFYLLQILFFTLHWRLSFSDTSVTPRYLILHISHLQFIAFLGLGD